MLDDSPPSSTSPALSESATPPSVPLARAAAVFPTSPGWPGPGWPQVQPTLTIPLISAIDGQTNEPNVFFTPDGSRAIVIQNHRSVLSWHNVRASLPDLALLALIIVWTWLFLRIIAAIRAHAHPRIPGHWYCRKCAYDLTPPTTDRSSRRPPADLPARCSECGVSTTARRPRRAHRSTPRIFVPVLITLIVTTLAGGIFAVTLEPASRLNAYATTIWPSPSIAVIIDDYTIFPLLQRTGSPYAPFDALTISVFELPTGSLISRERIAVPYTFSHVSSDSTCVYGIFGSDTGAIDTWSLDLRAQPPHLSRHAFPARGHFAPIPHASSSNTILFQELARADDQPWGNYLTPTFPTTPSLQLRIWKLDADSGAWTRLVNVHRPLERPIAVPQFSFLSAADLDPAHTHFAFILQKFTGRTPLMANQATIYTGTEGSITERTVDVTGLQAHGFIPGSRAKRAQFYALSAPAVPSTLDLTTGVLTPDPPAPWHIQTPDGLLRFEYPAIPPRFVHADGSIAAVPCLGTSPCFPKIGDEGRWAWVSVPDSWPPRQLSNIIGYRLPRATSIALWNLDAIKRPPPPPPVHNQTPTPSTQ